MKNIKKHIYIILMPLLVMQLAGCSSSLPSDKKFNYIRGVISSVKDSIKGGIVSVFANNVPGKVLESCAINPLVKYVLDRMYEKCDISDNLGAQIKEFREKSNTIPFIRGLLGKEALYYGQAIYGNFNKKKKEFTKAFDEIETNIKSMKEHKLNGVLVTNYISDRVFDGKHRPLLLTFSIFRSVLNGEFPKTLPLKDQLVKLKNICKDQGEISELINRYLPDKLKLDKDKDKDEIKRIFEKSIKLYCECVGLQFKFQKINNTFKKKLGAVDESKKDFEKAQNEYKNVCDKVKKIRIRKKIKRVGYLICMCIITQSFLCIFPTTQR